MKTAVQVLEKMEEVLGELIRNAEDLKDISMGDFSEEKIAPLQQHQEIMVEELNKLETNFEVMEKEGQEELLAKIGDRLAKKLRYFQHLNAVFVENISEGNFMEDYWKSDTEMPDIGVPHRQKGPVVEEQFFDR